MTHDDLLKLCLLSETSRYEGTLSGWSREVLPFQAASIRGPNALGSFPREVRVIFWSPTTGASDEVPILIYEQKQNRMGGNKGAWWHQIGKETKAWLLTLDWEVDCPKHPLIQLALQAE